MDYTTFRPLAILVLFLFTRGAAECVKFSTYGVTAAKYDFYRFYDFRNLGNVGGAPSFAASNEKVRTFSTVPWAAGWNERSSISESAQANTVDLLYTPSQISIHKDTQGAQSSSTYLTLHTTRASNGTQLSAELEYEELNVTRASIRLSGRVRGASGAVAGFFTYHNDTTESDIEVLTKDPSRQIRYSNQPTTDPDTNKAIGGSTFNRSLTHKETSDWNVHRLDLVSPLSAWYVNGALSAMTNINVPNIASGVKLNMWSNGGSFSGVMAIGGEAWFDVQWIELMFNTNSSPSLAQRGQVCTSEYSPGILRPVG